MQKSLKQLSQKLAARSKFILAALNWGGTEEKEMIEIEINECPKGKVNSTCKTEECIYQEGKWKGDILPTFSISERKENGKFDITCDDETE